VCCASAGRPPALRVASAKRIAPIRKFYSDGGVCFRSGSARDSQMEVNVQDVHFELSRHLSPAHLKTLRAGAAGGPQPGTVAGDPGGGTVAVGRWRGGDLRACGGALDSLSGGAPRPGGGRHHRDGPQGAAAAVAGSVLGRPDTAKRAWGSGASPPAAPASGRDLLLLSALAAGASVRISLDDLAYSDFLERNGLRIVEGMAHPDGRMYRPTVRLTEEN
jgi:hypothetical protein